MTNMSFFSKARLVTGFYYVVGNYFTQPTSHVNSASLPAAICKSSNPFKMVTGGSEKNVRLHKKILNRRIRSVTLLLCNVLKLFTAI